ncbi:carboxypeptidase-like regulatory domain-containing protein [Lutimonas zeaxanthinifaciens]|uniref:carboxypeptidase-like regulatory domain-containing protein n=1 Tax=Lutimonas zeaxanthinifaciens TaxID=3060215 RepID=UPI00265C9279|nr:carboxypeptidase-like regulatory domain-containing protein [Lutimonas sp. YSD2104]WKK65306.1 carboxypeptidase-like regulatory domain-containing protein [Lutimonas sp. YSD2104]
MTLINNKLRSTVAALFLSFIYLSIFLISQHDLMAQDTGSSGFGEYKGMVMDGKSKKTLEYASITVSNSNISTISNLDGEFLLKVPDNLKNESVIISYLGYNNKVISLSSFGSDVMKIMMEESFEELPDVNLVEVEAVKVVKKVIEQRKVNSYQDPLIVKAFYRESIKKRRTYASLAEAVVDVYKSQRGTQGDYATLERSRKSTDYRKIDTLVIKLQGGPYNNLSMDMMRNKDLFFTGDMFEIYKFTFDKMINLDDRNVYVIDFVQRPSIVEPFYEGKLYVDTESYALVKSVFSLNLRNLEKAKKFFVKKKPANADVIPMETKYIIDYKETGGKWHFSYSRIELSFKIKWDKKLFNSVYNVAIEMAVTDWKQNTEDVAVKNRDRMRRNVILTDETSGFTDPQFWGELNVIEPDKSIENAIKKIQRNYSR